MGIINKYYEKQAELVRLNAEIAELEESAELKVEMEFKAALETLMKEYGKVPREVAKIVGADLGSKRAGQNKRTPSTWVNPHTGEKVVTAGANHKRLKEWRNQYGADTVAKWKS